MPDLVGLVVVSHSRALARAAVGLASEMAQGAPVRVEIAAGIDEAGSAEPGLGTDAAAIAEAIGAADGPAGVVVLMDLGSAVLSAELALEFVDPEVADRVVLSPAPLVEGLVAAVVAAAGGAGRAEVAAEAVAGAAAKTGHLADQDAGPPPVEPAPSADGGALRGEFVVTDPMGLHARPAAALVGAVRGAGAPVTFRNATTGSGPVPAESLSRVATLGALAGHRVEVTVPAGQEAALARVLRAAGELFGSVAPPSEAAAADRAGPAPVRETALPPAAGALGGAAGIVVGVVRQEAAAVRAGRAQAADPDTERRRLDAALTSVATDVRATRERVVRELGESEAEIFDAHLMLLDDPGLRDPALAAIAAGADAGGAWAAAAGDAEAAWSALPDPYLRARAADLAALRDQVLTALSDVALPDVALSDAARTDAARTDAARTDAARTDAARTDAARTDAARTDAARTDAARTDAAPPDVAPAGPEPSADPALGGAVLVADDLSPAQAVALDPARIAGVVLAAGSPTAHAVILLRARGIPAVVAAGDLVRDVPDGTAVAFDGSTGELVLDPAPEVRARFAAAGDAARARAAAASAVARQPARTRDGVHVEVGANLGSVADARAAAEHGADLSGLVRTEFLFLDRDTAPTVDEQLGSYRALAEAFGGRRLTLRTLDVGGDKPLRYAPVPPTANPFLSVRGLRFSLLRPGMFREQLIAMVLLAHETPVTVLFPMVSTVGELRAARTALDAAIRATGRGAPTGLRVGAMIEVPAAALKSAVLAPLVDVFSIGTNDLTQYTMAAARGDGGVAALGDPWDPGVLRLIDAVCRGAAGRATVSVCGEFAGDAGAPTVLVGLGVRELSVAPARVPEVKQAVREISSADAADAAAVALTAEGPTGAREAATA
ncbi:putative PEP-binding protein [Cryptosporangium sp. NPDC051539]|uniref:phosphoenolpyruvate--protein phosphotransferase n=1 Tax=Cryptosporangium sp. NPDC051539 TaxID=3363962 RepID=UPI0037B55004